MTTGCILRYTRFDVEAETLDALAGQEIGPWLYAEKPADTVLIWLSDAPEYRTPWHAWRHGRIFGPEREFAWWREAEGLFTCRLLAETAHPGPEWGTAEEYVAIAYQAESTLLHGLLDMENVDPPTWSEARIPRYLSYPVAAAGLTIDTRAVLLTQRYHGPSGDTLSRLTAVSTLTPEIRGEADAG